jgi:acetylornithine deacetylase/succinyl-diaminopimelate desuccinylase-like protein
VPDRCRIHIDRRLTGGETRERAVEELEDVVKRLQPDAVLSVPEYQGRSWTGYDFKQEAYFPTWLTADDHPLVRAAMATAADCGAPAGKSGFWQFSTNGVATAGRLNIPTIGFAPGREELAHTAKEELNLDDLLVATRFYALLPFYLLETLHEKRD